jgi:hypothetical protein
MAAGPYTGAHNFVADPKSAAPAAGSRDFAAEQYPQSKMDTSGVGTDDPASIPAGGPWPYPAADPSAQEQAREHNPGIADKAPLPYKNLR